MGVIAKQSGYAAIALGVGLLVGTANNIVVLPRAFEGREAIWGLVRIMTSWGLILGSLSTLGAPSAMMRFMNQLSEADRSRNFNTILAIALSGLAITLGLLVWKGQEWIAWLDPNNSELLTSNSHWFIAIIAIMSLLHLFRSLLTLALRTGHIAWIDEGWQKVSYFGLAILLWIEAIPVEWFAPLYVGTYAISLILLGAPTLGFFQSMEAGFNQKELPKFAQFSSFSLLAGSAALIANQLDYIMVGKYLGLEEVPVYTLGFFIGSVVAMPNRATNNIVRGILAAKINSPQEHTIDALTKNTARVNMLLTASLMAGIWAGFDPFQQLLPEKYQGLQTVFLCIGLAQVISGLNTTTNQYLAFSAYYKLVLPINVALVGITVGMNYVFLVVFNWGLNGAALATLGTFLWSNTWRIWIVKRKLGTHPFTWSIPVIAAVAVVLAWAFQWNAGTLGFHPILEAVIQGGLAAGGTFAIGYGLGYFPELRNGIKQRFPWWP